MSFFRDPVTADNLESCSVITIERKYPGWTQSVNRVAKAALRLFGPSVLSPKPGMVSMLNGAWSPEDFLGVRSVQASSSPGLLG